MVLKKVARGLEPSEVPLVNRVAFALKIWAEISADFRAFIPIEPKPAQPVVDRAGRFLGVARLVGVLDPQDKFPAVCGARKSQLKSAVRAPPMWRKPVGEGAKRTRVGAAMEVVILSEVAGSRKRARAILLQKDDPGASARVEIVRQIHLRYPQPRGE